MPMKINVGLSKKIGLPDYGSLGATCHVDFEVDQGLLQHDLEAFHRQVRNAYVACPPSRQRRVGAAPAGQRHGQPRDEHRHKRPGRPASHNGNNGNGAGNNHTNGNGANGNGSNGHRNGSSGHGASEKQLSFAKQLSKGIQGLGIRRLETLAQKMYGKPLAGLTTMDASGLIDTLKGIKAGEINLDSVLEGNAT